MKHGSLFYFEDGHSITKLSLDSTCPLLPTHSTHHKAPQYPSKMEQTLQATVTGQGLWHEGIQACVLMAVNA
jgi:hypothetical protein